MADFRRIAGASLVDVPPCRMRADAYVFNADGVPSIELVADHAGELAPKLVVELAGGLHVVAALELLDRRAGRLVHDAGRLELAVAEVAERALHRQHLARRLG